VIYCVSYFNFGGFVAFWGGKPTSAAAATGLVTNRRVFRKPYYQTMPAVTNRPFGCSAVIITSYVRRLLRWTALFSAAIANLQWRSQPKNLERPKCLILGE